MDNSGNLPGAVSSNLRVGRIGFLGTGNLTDMLVRRLVDVGIPAAQITASARNVSVAKTLQRDTGITLADTAQDIVDTCRIVFVCLPLACARQELLSLDFSRDHLVVSMVGGLKLDRLETAIAPANGCCTMLPGLPSKLGVGLTLLSPPVAELSDLLGHFGAVMPCEDAETFTRLSTYGGLSGCLFHQAHQIEMALGQIDIDPVPARELIGNAFLGVGKTLLSCPDTTVAALATQVVTPGGITEKGIHQLDNAGAQAAWVQAMHHMALALAPVTNPDVTPLPEKGQQNAVGHQ